MDDGGGEPNMDGQDGKDEGRGRGGMMGAMRGWAGMGG